MGDSESKHQCCQIQDCSTIVNQILYSKEESLELYWDYKMGITFQHDLYEFHFGH